MSNESIPAADQKPGKPRRGVIAANPEPAVDPTQKTAFAEREKRSLPAITLEQSYRICHHLVRKHLGSYQWCVWNLHKEKLRHLEAVFALAIRANLLCDIHLGRRARLDQFDDLREDLRNNLMREETSSQHYALVNTITEFNIPQQFVHDILSAPDYCARRQQFETFDQWLQLGCRIGGSTMMCCATILGLEKDGHESAALSCGQAIYSTYLLGEVCCEIQKFQFFMPHEDIDAFEIDLQRINPMNPDKSVIRLIRLQVERIERLFYDGGRIMEFLTRDGQRVMKSVFAAFWTKLMQIKFEPQSILVAPNRLTRHDQFRLRLKHLLGTEGSLVVFSESESHGTSH